MSGFSERNHVEQQSRKKDLPCQRVCSAVPLLLAEDTLQLSGVRDLWVDPAPAGLNGPRMKHSEVEFPVHGLGFPVDWMPLLPFRCPCVHSGPDALSGWGISPA